MILNFKKSYGKLFSMDFQYKNKKKKREEKLPDID